MAEITKAPPAPTFLRLSAGFIYFFFGFLKFFPDLSPAELLAGQSIMRLTNYMVDAQTALFWLAIFECIIGLSFLFNVFLRWLFCLFIFHQLSTFLPLFMFPEITFKFVPFAPTFEGQYIFKNLISLSAGWTVMFPAVKASFKASRQERVARKALLAEQRGSSPAQPTVAVVAEGSVLANGAASQASN